MQNVLIFAMPNAYPESAHLTSVHFARIDWAMTALQFARWRERMGFTQEEAGAALGKSRRIVQKWEANSPIPFVVELACKWLEESK